MSEQPRWPNAEEQLVIHSLLTEYGDEGYGLCFLFGAYRAQGLSCEDALARLQRDVASQQGEKACRDVCNP